MPYSQHELTLAIEDMVQELWGKHEEAAPTLGDEPTIRIQKTDLMSLALDAMNVRGLVTIRKEANALITAYSSCREPDCGRSIQQVNEGRWAHTDPFITDHPARPTID
jgi:hypothetical protein